jgi:hypothetical protein
MHELTKNWFAGCICYFRTRCDYPHYSSHQSFRGADRRSDDPVGRELGVCHRLCDSLYLDVATFFEDGLTTDESLALTANGE